MADLTESSQSDAVQERLRALPSVERLASSVHDVPHAAAINAAREELDELRERIQAGDPVDADPAVLREVVAERARLLADGSLRPVINATGVILHTN
ncbi:MAG: hypothetical protein E6G49_04485, partial [Actinobacteria bacterium]